MRVAYLSCEVAPYAKTGGLGDVAGALPRYLREAGVDARVFMPRYGSIDPPRKLTHHMRVPMGGHAIECAIAQGEHPNGTPMVYIEHEGLFGGRYGIYGDGYGEFGDNGYRFAAFCKAALETFHHLDWWPDVVHAHDWHCGPAMVFLSEVYPDSDPRAHMGRVFTIHNQAYQGWQGTDWVNSAGVPHHTLHPGGIEHHGAVNLLKAGIQYAHKVTTVSPTYAREICGEGGFGLSAAMRYRARDLHGILNGIDMEEWNPEDDPHLNGLSYHSGDLSAKAMCKRALQAEVGLYQDDRPMLLGTVSRLVAQKGIQLILNALPTLMNRPVQFVLLGTGERSYMDSMARLAARYPGRVSAQLRFDNGLAHRIEAGVDAFLMPSYYEPCGLNQMYSLRYGTLPIVRYTGGLADTVLDLDGDPHNGVGFTFDPYSAAALVHSVDRALRWYYDDPDGWHWARVRAMLRDNSWGRSASTYTQLYQAVSNG